MLSSRSTTVGKSSTSSKLSSSSLASKKKDSFLLYCYKRLIAMFSAIWGKTRKTLWILSTGTHMIM